MMYMKITASMNAIRKLAIISFMYFAYPTDWKRYPGSMPSFVADARTNACASPTGRPSRFAFTSTERSRM